MGSQWHLGGQHGPGCLSPTEVDFIFRGGLRSYQHVNVTRQSALPGGWGLHEPLHAPAACPVRTQALD